MKIKSFWMLKQVVYVVISLLYVLINGALTSWDKMAWNLGMISLEKAWKIVITDWLEVRPVILEFTRSD